MATLVKGADAVVHAAYEHLPGRYRGGEGGDLQAYLDANLAGSLTLMRLAHAAHVGRFVLISSRAVYGPRLPDRPLDEDHPALPDTHYGAYKAAVQAFLSAFGPGWQACALRPTGVYGLTHPVERSKWHGLVAAVSEGRLPPAKGRGVTEVHGADVARVV